MGEKIHVRLGNIVVHMKGKTCQILDTSTPPHWQRKGDIQTLSWSNVLVVWLLWYHSKTSAAISTLETTGFSGRVKSPGCQLGRPVSLLALPPWTINWHFHVQVFWYVGLCGSAFPVKTKLSIARNLATIASVLQRFKGRRGNWPCVSDTSFRSSFIYRQVRKMATSKTRKTVRKLAKGNGDSCTVRVLVTLMVRSHWVKMAFLAPFHFPGPVRRNWYGVHGPKKMVKARRGSVRSRENRLGFASM